MVHPVDLHVGARVRARRMAIGMTQQALAARLGVTFQQVQKYELGSNRVSASRLWAIAQAMGVPVSFFYEGLARKRTASGAEGAAPPGPSCEVTDGQPLDRQAAALLRSFAAIDAPKRARLLDLARALSHS